MVIFFIYLELISRNFTPYFLLISTYLSGTKVITHLNIWLYLLDKFLKNLKKDLNLGKKIKLFQNQ